MSSGFVITNANIATLDPLNPRVEAISISRGKITSVGTRGQVLKKTNNSEILDLGRKTVLPGFIDSHVHLADFGLTVRTLDLEGTTSIEEIQGLLERRIKETPKGAWVVGRGWSEHKLGRLLSRWDLDGVSPQNPVYLHHYTCHATVLNSEGLEESRIDKNTVDPIGGWIVRDSITGEPTGFLRSNARFLPPVGLNGVRPRPGKAEHRSAIITGANAAVEYGLTSIHVPSADLDDVEICCELASKGMLPLRVDLMLKVELFDKLPTIRIPQEVSDRVKLKTVKIFSDGSLIAHTAALKEPFIGEKDNRGILGDKKLFTDQIVEAHKAGFQLAVHATGDRAVESVLDAFQRAQAESPRDDCRHRIEHGSLIDDSLRKRAKALGVIVSTQPELLTKYGDRFVKSLGSDRVGNAYALKSLLNEGVVVAGGSDCPLTYCRPLKGIEAAVTRVSEITGEVISPEQRLTIDEAVKLYTINPAYAAFSENMKGSIKVGKYADLTVLDSDPWSVKPSEISKIKVEMTIVNGEIVYNRKGKTGRLF